MAVEIESSELIAKRISEAGSGLYPVSKIREAIFAIALEEVRILKAEAPPVPRKRHQY